MKKIYYIFIFLTGFSFFGCKEKYDPPLASLPKSFLVVEGTLKPGNQPTTIRLTRTSKLDKNATVQTENNATLTVEGNNNTTAFLAAAGNGNYISNNLNLNPNNEYRLRIKTTDGKEYLSDYVKVKITPPIDSISWRRETEGVRIYANAKDPSNNTVYYRWDYEETWEIRSVYGPTIIYENGRIRDRVFPQENVSICWKNNLSTNIILANSLRLKSDIINEAPILFIPLGDEKLLWRYSVLVRQYAMDKEAYNFFDLMKRNSEDIGSIFSPQPSEIKGNIHCVTDPAEFVVGFVTASTVPEKRIFIEAGQVVPWPSPNNCIELRVHNIPDSIRYFVNGGYMPYYHIIPPPDDLILFSTPDCVDCRTRGGSTARPLFW